MKNDRVTYLIIIGSIVLTLSTIVLNYYQTQKSKEAAWWVHHTYDVINQSGEFLSLVKDAETGQRGYLITGDTSYLTPYKFSERSISSHYARLEELVSDNTEQEQLLHQRVKRLMESRTKSLKSIIKTFETRGRDSAFAQIKKNVGKKVMDSLRIYMKTFTENERLLLEKRQANLAKYTNLIDLTRYASLTCVALISLVALFSLLSKQGKNNSLLSKLRQFNRHLEAVVARRTQELEEKNKITVELNDELKQSVEELHAMNEAISLEHAKTEAALAEANDLYNNAPTGYHSADIEGTILKINDTSLSWLGYTREELVGKRKFRELLSPESAKTLPAIYEEFKRTSVVTDLEFEVVRKDGTMFPILLSATTLYNKDGSFLMSRSVVYDLTERKKFEHSLHKANEKMSEANAEKNNFLAIASHDLKSPLNAMLGLLNLFKLDNKNLTADQQDNLVLVSGAARNMKAIIDKLLDLSRIEQGKSFIQKSEVDLIPLIEKNISSARVTAGKKNISIVFEDHPPCLRIHSDSGLITQVLDNLISNAVKFSLPDKKVQVAIAAKEEQVCIKITDEGPGFREDEIGKVFGKFQKLSARPTGGETSTGLGLSIVKELVVILDGKISFQTAQGKGSTFDLLLPMN